MMAADAAAAWTSEAAVFHVRNLRDRLAAVTGAGSGIGRALAVRLAHEGCRVAISSRGADGLSETARLTTAEGALVDSAVVDVADRDAVHAWADRLVAEHGPAHLVFNNAGVTLISTVEMMSYEDLDWIMGINFWGVVHGTKAFLPHLRRAGEGCIVNMSSVFGFIGYPTQASYSASKFAVRGFTETLRQELELDGSRITAIGVYPGGVNTNVVRSARMGADQVLGMDHRRFVEEFDRVARTSADRVARTIIRGVKRNRPRIVIGTDAHLIDCIQRLFPSGYHGLVVGPMRPGRRS